MHSLFPIFLCASSLVIMYSHFIVFYWFYQPSFLPGNPKKGILHGKDVNSEQNRGFFCSVCRAKLPWLWKGRFFSLQLKIYLFTCHEITSAGGEQHKQWSSFLWSWSSPRPTAGFNRRGCISWGPLFRSWANSPYFITPQIIAVVRNVEKNWRSKKIQSNWDKWVGLKLKFHLTSCSRT